MHSKYAACLIQTPRHHRRFSSRQSPRRVLPPAVRGGDKRRASLLLPVLFTLQYAIARFFQQADGGKRLRSRFTAGMACRPDAHPVGGSAPQTGVVVVSVNL